MKLLLTIAPLFLLLSAISCNKTETSGTAAGHDGPAVMTKAQIKESIYAKFHTSSPYLPYIREDIERATSMLDTEKEYPDRLARVVFHFKRAQANGGTLTPEQKAQLADTSKALTKLVQDKYHTDCGLKKEKKYVAAYHSFKDTLSVIGPLGDEWEFPSAVETNVLAHIKHVKQLIAPEAMSAIKRREEREAEERRKATRRVKELRPKGK
ncbi:MAG: hypothetical protein QGH60_15535 [Phycisphaerae bacterium]|jgi:hypothetical protein|nr:hypothetical protein [Phycisphaerae bacterium]